MVSLHKSIVFLFLPLVIFEVFFSSFATTPPEYIPYRFQGGELFLESLLNNNNNNGPGFNHNYLSLIHTNSTPNNFDQVVDHNNPSSGVFKQRFYMDRTAWDGNINASIVAVLCIGGENEVISSTGGFVAEWAYSVNAIIFTLEHRWYGQSNPYGKDYKNVTKLKSTLNVKNALADIQSFINYVSYKFIYTVAGIKSNAKTNEILNLTWITVGGGYAGALSAWFKSQNQNNKNKNDISIAAAWSSSAIVNPRFDFSGYEGYIIEAISPVCESALRFMYEKLYGIWDDKKKFNNVQALFNISNLSREEFSDMLADAYSAFVQYGHKKDLCYGMAPVNTSDPITQFSNLVKKWFGNDYAARKMMFNLAKKGEKKEINSEIIPFDADAMSKSEFLWTFQRCNELALWQIGYPKSFNPGSIRPEIVSTDYFMNMCFTLFNGTEIYPNTFLFNNRMGGKKTLATHVVATQGSDDPLRVAGINQPLSDDYPFALASCYGCGHCGDLYLQNSSTDSIYLHLQRVIIVQYINKWMGLVFNATFYVEINVTSPEDLQESVLQVLKNDTWMSTMVYECDGLGTSNALCYLSFNSEKKLDIAINLANEGKFDGVIKATKKNKINPSSNPGSSFSPGLILGIVVAGAMTLVILVAFIIVIRRKKKNRTEDYTVLN